MSEIRDKIARALFDVRDDEFDMDEWEDLDSTDRERWVCDADAVLPLIREAQVEALMDARHLVIGTPGFKALTDRAAAYRVGEGEQ